MAGAGQPVAQIFLGVELTGVAVVLARVAGVALTSLGIACFPGRGPMRAAASGMLTYNLVVATYLVYLGIRGEWVGPLLWPVAGLHAILAVLLARAWLAERKQSGRRCRLPDIQARS